jgi:hypothetical protein
MPRPIEQPKQLVVEGTDAERLFAALLQTLGLINIQVQNFGGNAELRSFLKALKNTPGFVGTVTSVGIIRDAETDPRAAFQSASTALVQAGLELPQQPEQFTAAIPRTGIFILPDALTPGMLETVCLKSVADDPATICVDDFFTCVEQTTGTLPGNLPKARVQAFLASRSRPGLRLGEAAQAGYWSWDHPAFDSLKQFLRAL